MHDVNLSNRLKTLRVVFIFTGDIVPTDEKEYRSLGWRSSRGLEADKTGPVFSYERVLAAAVLYRMNSRLTFVPSGGQTNTGANKSPPIASVVSLELQMLGVPAVCIAEEPMAFNALEQVTNCATLARNEGWYGPDCAILAPVWQLGRIAAMITMQGRDASPFAPGVTSFISMERALAAEDPAHWNTYFKESYARPEFQAMLASEAMGIGQLWSGHQPKYPNPFRGFHDPIS